MARKKSAATIEAEIAKVKSEMEKLQGRYDTLAEKLKELEAQKRRAESEAIMDAYVKSGRSLDEVLTFLQP